MSNATATKSTGGRFVWHDLMTSDVKKAKAFYTQLFGWTTKEMDMGPAGKYTMLHAGEKGIGGIESAKGGTPSHWLGYVSVDDVDGAAEQASSLGGKVIVPPTDIPNVARFAVVADAQGAVLAPFKGNKAPEPRPEGQPVPGTFCFSELHTNDTDKASSFYTKIFGWKTESHDMGPMGTYTLFKGSDGKDGGGMMKLKAPNVPPHWLHYVAVKNVDATTDKARGLGAKVVVEPMDIPNIGRFSVLVDPTGASFALWFNNHTSKK